MLKKQISLGEKMNRKRITLIVISSVLVLAVVSGLIYYFLGVLPEQRRRAELELAYEEYYQNKLSLYQEENERYSDFEVDVAFIGDSLTDGYDLQQFYPDYVTANRGIGGETTFGLEKRLQVSVYDLKPKIVVMLIGGNNLKTMFENYEQILEGLQANLPNSKIVLVSLTAMGDALADKNELASYNNVKIKKLAEEFEFSFVDVFSKLLNMQTNEIYEDYTTDGAHLTKAGYEVVTSEILPVVKSLLK